MTAKLGFTKEQVEAAYAGDASMADAARTLGCSEEPLRKLIRAYGIPSKPKFRTDVPPLLQDRDWVAAQVSGGKADKEIAEELQVTVHAVGYWRRFHKIAARPASDRVKGGIRDRWPNGRRGDEAANWRGGRTSTMGKKGGGYILIYKPDHPAANRHGQVFEHRLVMEQTIGRLLNPGELVHHRDRNRSNNAPENLSLMRSRSEHVRTHYAAAEQLVEALKDNDALKARLDKLEAMIGKLSE